MDLFKKAGIKLATSLDWNCKDIVKRKKGDTQKIHQNARNNLKKDLKNILKSIDK